MIIPRTQYGGQYGHIGGRSFLVNNMQIPPPPPKKKVAKLSSWAQKMRNILKRIYAKKVFRFSNFFV